ncbi:unnamed protein product [Triticum turgidum subsp. durum]|uniref:Uncharacterized protein n=1 Tax=Triticum turgidum subsp. durum TaxID=4567 RepID=A0A9R0Y9E2_TRITD|nr:unnamed protein product [Triticum turgidum subsp. durum]
MKRRREAFDFNVRKEVFAVGKMCGEERNLLRKRFRAELVAVRGLLEKADRFLAPGAAEGRRGGAAPSSLFGLAALPGKKEGRPLLGAEPPSDVSMKADDGKRRMTTPLAEHKEAPKMTSAERQQLAFSLVALAAELSGPAVELLPKQNNGGRREIEVNVCSMEDAALFELKMHVDKLVKTRDPSLPPQDGSKIVEHEDDENGRRVDICPGVSPVVTTPSPLQLEILEYAAVFNATGLVDKMLSPLPQKYLALAEKREKECIAEKEDDEEYVDICGDASPVVFQNLIGAISHNPSIILSSDSDSDSDADIGSDSDSSDSGSVSDNHCDEKGGTLAPPVLPKVSSSAPAVLSKVINDSAPPSEPTLEVVQNGELKKLDNPAPAILPKVNGHSAGRPSEPAPVIQNAEPEHVSILAPSALCKIVDDSAAQPSEPALEVVPLQSGEPAGKHSSPAPVLLPKVNGDSAGQAPVLQNAEPEKVSSPSPAVLYKVVDGSAPSLEAGPKVVQNGFETEKLDSPTPTPSVNLSNVNDGSSLPSSKPTSEMVQNAEPEKLPDKPPARPMSELIAAALEKRRREERSQAREKARQDLVETERSAMTSHRVHPADMERLGILDIEHMVTQHRRPGVPPSLLQQLGLFLRADEDDCGEQQQPISDPGVQDLEEGEILPS